MKFIAMPLLLMLSVSLAACGETTAVVETQEPAQPPVPTATDEPEVVDVQSSEIVAAQADDNSSPKFVISPETSEARFYIDEVLRGQPNTVEGTTQQLAGTVMIQSLDPLTVTIQPVEIQAGTFVTDSNFRNRAISGAILQAGRFPTIIFTPTNIEGLPDKGELGQSYTFEVTGELTIRDTTLPVTFAVSLKADSANAFSGTASTMINRTDFGLSIPSVQQVANVSEQVIIEFDFSATRDM